MFVIPNTPFKGGNSWPGGQVNSKCCNIPASKRKSSAFAKGSPKQLRLPEINKYDKIEIYKG